MGPEQPRGTATAFMVLDVLREVLGRADNPGQVGEYLTQQMRELTGARVVALLEYPLQGADAGVRIISLCPARRAAGIDPAACGEFARLFRTRDLLASNGRGAERRTADLLAALGAANGFALPLDVGAVDVGALLFLDMPENDRFRDVVSMLEPLSTVVGLVLRNALLFEHQEAVISQRTREIRESEERFRLVVEAADDAVFLHEDNGVIRKVNPAACRMLGYAAATLEGMNIASLSAHYGHDEVLALERELADRGRVELTDELRTRTGELVPVEVRLTHIERGDRTLTLALARDISERRRAEAARLLLEAQLRQSQKMEAIGTLAGGIAHDFNNILTPILAHAELALLDLPAGSAVRENLDAIGLAARRAGDVVKQILAFSRREELARKPSDMRRVVTEALGLIRASLPSTIAIEERIDPGAGVVVAVPTQIYQVLVNLCTNAAHAMRETGGVLHVTLDKVALDGAALPGGLDGPPPAGAYVRLSVSDTGHGMDARTRERVFDPYFTTKGVGEGSGLGLSVVHGIVNRHGGFLAVRSAPGEGAAFEVYLPRTDLGIVPAADTRAPAPAGSEHIMFVDDEPAIASIGRRILAHVGYQVTAFTDSREALRAFEASPGAFDLIVTDQTLPGMTGLELTRSVCAARPGMPVLICTGHSEALDEAKARSAGARGLLMKPFTRDGLSRAVRDALDAG